MIPSSVSSSKASRYSPLLEHWSYVHDFFTLLKPGVMSLVVFTAYGGMKAAAVSFHPFLQFTALLAIALGSGGAAALNMWYDRDIDGKMKRTQNRPLPQGRIAPEDALVFGLLLSLLSIALMDLATNLLAASLLGFSIFFYAVIYTMWLKRKTPYNIVIGGAAGAFPPVIGWAATGVPLSLEPWLLFLIIFLWTPPHFWALALNRSTDYEKAHVPMLPNVAGRGKTQRQILGYSVALVATSLSPWALHFKGNLYGGIAAGLGLVFLGFALKVFYKGDQGDCKKLFLFSILYLFLLFIGGLLN